MRSADAPYPPPELANRVFGVQYWGDPRAAYEELGAQTDQVVREQAVRREYEDSLSWRVTRPLREMAARLRGTRARP